MHMCKGRGRFGCNPSWSTARGLVKLILRVLGRAPISLPQRLYHLCALCVWPTVRGSVRAQHSQRNIHKRQQSDLNRMHACGSKRQCVRRREVVQPGKQNLESLTLGEQNLESLTLRV